VLKLQEKCCHSVTGNIMHAGNVGAAHSHQRSPSLAKAKTFTPSLPSPPEKRPYCHYEHALVSLP
jgi:hypothetical protein